MYPIQRQVRIKAIIFIAITAGLAWLSRASLRDYRSHGFYRFFAWGAILALVLLNAEVWFEQPFSVPQIVSWFLLSLCTYLAVHALLLFHRLGKPDPQRSDPTLMGIEKTTELVTVGIYKYIRHPMYGSLLFLTWGVFYKRIHWVTFLLAAFATIFLVITAKIEEGENIRYFGDAYKNYCRRTKMFIPFIL